jgi:hypothetical protein
MRWFTIRMAPPPPVHPAGICIAARCERTESIRVALVDALVSATSSDMRLLIGRIRNAGDAEHLWNLRPEVMCVLASLVGETHAREMLARISFLFEDVLPDGLASNLRTAGWRMDSLASRRRDSQKETA